MAPKRRASVQKAAAYVSTLGEVEEWKEHKQLIEQIQVLLKKASTPTLRVVKSILDGGAEAEEGHRLPRGIKQLGGANNVCIPNYIVVSCLSKVMKCSKSIISSLSSDDRRNLFMFGVGGEPETLVPERKDFVSNFEDWWVKQYVSHGERFKNLAVQKEMEIDWVWATGYFELMSKSGSTDVFDSLHCRLSGEIMPLPRGMTIPKESVGREGGFELSTNWLLNSAKLVDHSAGCEFSLVKQFSGKEVDFKGWNPLSCDDLGEVMGSSASSGPVRVGGKRPAGTSSCAPPPKAPKGPEAADVGDDGSAPTGSQQERQKVVVTVAAGQAGAESENALVGAAKEIEQAMGTSSEGAPEVVLPPA